MANIVIEITKKQIEDAGFPVHNGSSFCSTHIKKHGNCKGCESVEGCCRLSALLFIHSNFFKKYSNKEDVDTDELFKEAKVAKQYTEKILQRDMSVEEIHEYVSELYP